MTVIKCFNSDCRCFDREEPDHCSRLLIKIQKCVHAIIKKDGRSTNWYYEQLWGNECLCGKPKKKGQSFCYGDFKELPREMQQALYNLIGQGYEAAYEEAVTFLEREIW